MEKYKEAGNGQIVRYSVDENGKEIPNTRTSSFSETDKPRTMGAGFYQEYLKHVDEGGEVEPFETPAEIEAREADEAIKAIEETRSLCIQYLDDSEKHVTDDPPYPDNVQEWKDKRAEWRVILKSGTAQTVPDKPYGAE